jgi:hypothetical protein
MIVGGDVPLHPSLTFAAFDQFVDGLHKIFCDDLLFRRLPFFRPHARVAEYHESVGVYQEGVEVGVAIRTRLRCLA